MTAKNDLSAVPTQAVGTDQPELPIGKGGPEKDPRSGQAFAGKQLVLGLLFGLLFGFLLQKGGVAKYHVLIGVLLLEDFTVIKVMLTAILVGMIGVFGLYSLGLVNLHIKPTRYAANILGGLLFGVGFAFFAYCPGGIDVIVGGHSHNRMEKAEQVSGTLIVQAGAHGSDLGRLDLTVEKGKITDYRRTLVPLDHDKVPADAAAERFVTKLLEPHRKALDEVIGKASGWLVRAQTLTGQEAHKRDGESPIDSLFADILRDATKADIALLPGVGYGVAIPPGPITAAQMRQMVPHEGKVVTMRLSGVQVVEVLEQAVENTFTDDPAAKVGGMIQVGGIKFRYDPAMPRGHRVWHVERVGGKWEPMSEFTVVTNSMLAGGGHNYRTLTKGENRVEHDSQFETIRRWVEKNSPVATPKTGRIAKAIMTRPM